MRKAKEIIARRFAIRLSDECKIWMTNILQRGNRPGNHCLETYYGGAARASMKARGFQSRKRDARVHRQVV